ALNIQGIPQALSSISSSSNGSRKKFIPSEITETQKETNVYPERLLNTEVWCSQKFFLCPAWSCSRSDP
ncbi:hypothetical protein STEG23_013482, partial [Scotinomys teguina]